MPDVTIPYAQPGVASFELTDDYLNTVLLRGSHPVLAPAVSHDADDDVARFQVVGFANNDPSEGLTPAVWDADPADAIQAVGVVYVAAVAGERALYWYSGFFNSDMLVWDASFDTPEKKANAFVGAPTPTTIKTAPRFG